MHALLVWEMWPCAENRPGLTRHLGQTKYDQNTVKLTESRKYPNQDCSYAFQDLRNDMMKQHNGADRKPTKIQDHPRRPAFPLIKWMKYARSPENAPDKREDWNWEHGLVDNSGLTCQQETQRRKRGRSDIGDSNGDTKAWDWRTENTVRVRK